MKSTTGKHTAGYGRKAVVLSFIEALNKEDFKIARKYLVDEFTFKGVLGERNGADVYMEDMEKMKFKYDLKQAVADNDNVCLLYDFTQGGITLQGCGWYNMKADKINSLIAIFDPRPILEAAGKK